MEVYYWLTSCMIVTPGFGRVLECTACKFQLLRPKGNIEGIFIEGAEYHIQLAQIDRQEDLICYLVR